VQIAVLPVSEKLSDYAADICRQLLDAGIRVELDDSSDKIGSKIRRATMAKVPYMAVVGQREAQAGSVALRHRTAGDHGAMTPAALIEGLREEIRTKGAKPLVAGSQEPVARSRESKKAEPACRQAGPVLGTGNPETGIEH
jgi:threonyl-tRNA synthetase